MNYQVVGMKKKLTFVACDPGSTNFGICLGDIRVKKGVLQYRIRSVKKLESTVCDLKQRVGEQIVMYLNEIQEFATKKPNSVVIERFQARGLRGSTGEQVSIMIGALTTLYPDRTNLVIPSTWKNSVNRALPNMGERTPLEWMYKQLKGEVSAHEVDAAVMLIWAGHIATGFKPFEGWNKKRMAKLIKSLKKAGRFRER